MDLFLFCGYLGFWFICDLGFGFVVVLVGLWVCVFVLALISFGWVWLALNVYV